MQTTHAELVDRLGGFPVVAQREARAAFGFKLYRAFGGWNFTLRAFGRTRIRVQIW